MKDGTFRRHMRQLTAAKFRYMKELEVCEAEYERRFGFNPSEVDDDFWIDCFHVSGGLMDTPSVQGVVESAQKRRAAAC